MKETKTMQGEWKEGKIRQNSMRKIKKEENMSKTTLDGG
jgi:hypothetical protein